MVEKQQVRASFKDIALYDFEPPTPLAAAQLAPQLEALGDPLLAGVLRPGAGGGGGGGVGGAVCAVHTHKSRVEEEDDIRLTEVRRTTLTVNAKP